MYNEDELRRGVLYEKEEFNQKEIEYFRNTFLQHIANLVDYCDSEYLISTETRLPMTTRERLNLLATYICRTIDGLDSDNGGGYYLIPMTECHFSNPEYYIPENIMSKYNIAYSLFDLHKFINKENK